MKKQILAAVVVNLLSINYGIASGWIAPYLGLFRSEDSPIGKISTDEASWIVSLLSVGCLLGDLLFGFLGDYWGRKPSLMVACLPQIIANLLIIFGTNPYYVYVSRILVGLSGGAVFATLPIFVSETCHDSIRGAVGSLMPLCSFLGIVFGYGFSSWMDYIYSPVIPIALGVIFALVFVWLPESPDYLHHHQRHEEAQVAYNFYGNHRADLKVAETQQKPKFSLQDFKEPAVRRGAMIAITMIFFAEACGSCINTYYVSELLSWADLDMDVNTITVGMGLLQVLGCFVSCLLMDRVGRRWMFLTSAVIASLAMYAVAYYFNVRDEPGYGIERLRWMPVASLAVAILAMAWAIGSAPYFLIAELLPLHVRGLVTTVSMGISSGVEFANIHSFYFFVGLVGVSNMYFIYGTICLLEVMFVFFFLPETKNMSIGDIQKIMV